MVVRRPVKLFIAVPAYGESIFSQCVRSLFKLSAEITRRGWASSLATLSYADIAEGRNILLTHWYDRSDASHLLFVDADMAFEPALICDMVEFGEPVVGAIYPRRQFHLDRFAKAIAAGQPTEKAKAGSYDYVVREPSPQSTARNGFIRVGGCGTGILLVQRSCVDRLISKIPDLVDPRPPRNFGLGESNARLIRAFDFLTVDGDRLSEDFSFCHRWRQQCGGEVWANISHSVTHLGLQNFSASYADAPNPRVKVIEVPLSNIQIRPRKR